MNRNPSNNTQHPTDNAQPKAGCLPFFVVRWVLGVVTCVSLLALMALAPSAFAQDPRTIIEEAQRRSMSMSQRYEGTLRVINDKNKITEKRWSFERIGSHGDSKSILRFTAPAEVKGVALLVVNHPDRSSDQWMWTPAVGRDRNSTRLNSSH